MEQSGMNDHDAMNRKIQKAQSADTLTHATAP
jgi:hypothetical protein